MNNNVFEQIDFGPLKPYLADDDITDVSYDNGGQIHLKTLSKGIFRIENPAVNDAFMEKLAFQCSNVMGKTFNMAHPFLDAESAELRLAFIHPSIAQNGIACVVRKTPAKIRLQKDKIVADKYVELDIIDFLEQCVLGHCNIIASGETGSGKTEFIKYLASKIAEDEKIITIEDTLELHLDKIFPHRDIVAMKTNNIASYTEILEACMRQNPKWILLSEVRSAEAVLAVRNSISSGHYILSTIHADKASSIPNRLYSLLETNQDVNQFLSSICRYIQLGVYIRGYTDKATHNFKREIAEVTEFYVTEDTNEARHNVIYRKAADGKVIRNNPSPYLIDYLEVQGVFLPKELQNLAGEPYTDADSLKSNAENNKSNGVSVNSDKINANVQKPVNGVNNSVNNGNLMNNSNMNNNVNKAAINNSNMSNNVNKTSVNNFNANNNVNKAAINNSNMSNNVNSNFNVATNNVAGFNNSNAINTGVTSNSSTFNNSGTKVNMASNNLNTSNMNNNVMPNQTIVSSSGMINNQVQNSTGNSTVENLFE